MNGAKMTGTDAEMNGRQKLVTKITGVNMSVLKNERVSSHILV